MKILSAGYEILDEIDGQNVLEKLEYVGRVCYKSEERIAPGTAAPFIESLIKRGHEAIIEHFSFSVKFIVDRGVSHELVRHRLASWAQESTRYCNYGHAGECSFIAPSFWASETDPTSAMSDRYEDWKNAMSQAERWYLHLIDEGASPQEARSVLPNSLKTEVVMSANLREWRHFFRLRTADAAHPQMREVTRPLLDELRQMIPVVFDDIPMPWIVEGSTDGKS